MHLLFLQICFQYYKKKNLNPWFAIINVFTSLGCLVLRITSKKLNKQLIHIKQFTEVDLWKPVTKKEFQMHRNRAAIASLRACAHKMWLLKKPISLHCHETPSLLRDAVYNVRYQPTTNHSCQAISVTCRRRHMWTDISATKILEETFQFIHLQTHIYHLSPVLPTYSVQSHTSGHAVARSSQ